MPPARPASDFDARSFARRQRSSFTPANALLTSARFNMGLRAHRFVASHLRVTKVNQNDALDSRGVVLPTNVSEQHPIALPGAKPIHQVFAFRRRVSQLVAFMDCCRRCT